MEHHPTGDWYKRSGQPQKPSSATAITIVTIIIIIVVSSFIVTKIRLPAFQSESASGFFSTSSGFGGELQSWTKKFLGSLNWILQFKLCRRFLPKKHRFWANFYSPLFPLKGKSVAENLTEKVDGKGVPPPPLTESFRALGYWTLPLLSHTVLNGFLFYFPFFSGLQFSESHLVCRSNTTL